MSSQIKKEIYENQICSKVGKELIKYYPGWDWYVSCILDSGMVGVRNLSCDGEYGMLLPIMKVLNDTDGKLIMRAGGELLERYEKDRGPARKDIIHA